MFVSYLKIDDETSPFLQSLWFNFESIKQVDSSKQTLVFLYGGPGVVDHSLYGFQRG